MRWVYVRLKWRSVAVAVIPLTLVRNYCVMALGDAARHEVHDIGRPLLSALSDRTCPQVVGMLARSEAVGFNKCHHLGKPMRYRGRIVGVTPERDHLASFVAPPANYLAVTANSRCAPARQTHPSR